MATKIVYRDWQFDGALWAEKIRASVRNDDYQALAELLGVSALTVARWATNTNHKAFPFPQMSNFINTCNALDLDPRDFWELSE